jgi:zinc/manganese transport system ATP-binding protein
MPGNRLAGREGAGGRAQDDEVVRFDDATLSFGRHRLWDGLTFSLKKGEFLAVLGPNGSGKTTLLKVLLGLQPLSSGTVEIWNRPPGHGNSRIGYVPQQRRFDSQSPVRGRDLVRLGIDGHRAGIPLPRVATRSRVEAAIRSVGAEAYANAPLGKLSGGEQQRLRIAQALACDPAILLCDEPLLSLDIASQDTVASLIDTRRKEAETVVVFVTHEINPILPYVDKVVYLVDGQWAVGTPEQVFTSERMSELYGMPVTVANLGNRIEVVTSHGGALRDLMDEEKCRLLVDMEGDEHRGPV